MDTEAARNGGASVWRWLMPALCAAVFVVLVISIIDVTGFGAKPWLGYWDSITVASGQPYVAKIVQILPGGAAARAGLRDGDLVDLREVDVNARIGVLFQPSTRRTDLVVRREGKTFRTAFYGSTQFEGKGAIKIGNNALWLLANALMLICATLIALRRSQPLAGRMLCLTLLAIVTSGSLSPNSIALPNGWLGALAAFVAIPCAAATGVLPVALAARFGTRSPWRGAIEGLTYALAAATFYGGAACAVGLLTAAVDPIPYVYGTLWRALPAALYAAATLAVAAAVASTDRSERPRAAWLLLPVPVALLTAMLVGQIEAVTSTWVTYMAVAILTNLLQLAGAVAVTYAVLRRRVLDIQFVIGRTLVVAGVSAIVVVSFVLLEWLLGNVVVNASHVTGLIANAGLALVLGLSMQFIHQRVDTLVEFALFHKRHEAERALRDFAKEATFVTQREALLDLTIDVVQRQTDASAASLLLDGDGRYRAVRWFGQPSPDAGENDSAVLALKTWHKALDPHRYPTGLRGDVALPMLARGRLLGILVCGERSGGESYAPDDIEALTEVAHGVGSALEAFDRADLAASHDGAIVAELRALREAIERRP